MLEFFEVLTPTEDHGKQFFKTFAEVLEFLDWFYKNYHVYEDEVRIIEHRFSKP